MIRVAALVLLIAQPAQAERFYFCWAGAGGYTMTGVMDVSDTSMRQAIITETDVTSFQIIGFERGVAIGSWSLADRTPSTTWHLRFNPQTLTFPTGGNFPSDASQGWNADGDVEDCGRAGFGFNSGNYAQDICWRGVWMEQSSIDPDTPLRATKQPVTPDCRGVALLG